MILNLDERSDRHAWMEQTCAQPLRELREKQTCNGPLRVDFCSAIDASTLPAIYPRPGISSEEAIAMHMQPWLSKLQPGREVGCDATEAEAAASTELVYRYVAVGDRSSCTNASNSKTVDGHPKIGLIRSDKFCLYPKWQLEANGSEIQEMVRRWEELKFDPVNKGFRYKLQWALSCFYTFK